MTKATNENNMHMGAQKWQVKMWMDVDVDV